MQHYGLAGEQSDFQSMNSKNIALFREKKIRQNLSIYDEYQDYIRFQNSRPVIEVESERIYQSAANVQRGVQPVARTVCADCLAVKLGWCNKATSGRGSVIDPSEIDSGCDK